MILETTKDMYMAFLDGIKKEYTGTVIPSVFNRVINEWGQFDWLRQNVSYVEGIELTQKQIDDLSVLTVILDGNVPVMGTPLNPIGPTVGLINVFQIPDLESGPTTTPVGYYVTLPSYPAGVNVAYPRYYRLMNVMFKLMYVDNVCDLEGESDWLEAHIMRFDRETHILSSPYRKPSDSRLYYRLSNRHVQLITGTASYGIGMKLTYLRWPRNIFFDELNQSDVAGADYTPGNGSINCEFPAHIRKEIVDQSVRIYLERVRDPRYQTYLNEMALKDRSNV